MFQQDDYVVYGSNGVCKVKEIGNVECSMDKDKIYYTLEPVYSGGSTLYTPVDNTKVVMRKVLSREEASQLIDEMPGIEQIWIDNDKERDQAYKEIMKKYDCREWVKIIKTLYNHKKERIAEGKKFSTVDERYLNAAQDFLHGEIAFALGMKKDQIESYICERVNH